MNIQTEKWNNFLIIHLEGRIDGLTSTGFQRKVDQLTAEGHLKLILDFSRVIFMSSAGLRVIIQITRSLRPIGGEVILMTLPDQVRELFRVSGMEPFLKVVSGLEAIMPQSTSGPGEAISSRLDFGEFAVDWMALTGKTGQLLLLGDPDKLASSAYPEGDCHRVKPSEFRFGAGLAALGDDYNDFSNLFGETVVTDHHFFSFPAVTRPGVDYAFYTAEADHPFNFLYGFGFPGDFSGVFRFDFTGESPDLGQLLKAAATVASSSVFGVVMLGVSQGLHWMHLKKVPVLENQPPSGNIFAEDIFHAWMNFSPEREELNKTIITTGLVSRDPELIPERVRSFIPEKGGMHLHGIVFENGLLSRDIRDFETELARVARDFRAEKVVHLLPSSRLKSGFIGIINLDLH